MGDDHEDSKQVKEVEMIFKLIVARELLGQLMSNP